jgi:putative endonuclease
MPASLTPPQSSQRSGQQAEQWAERHLLAHGLRTLFRNWRCKRGELDLVMVDGDTVVFVEVRYRLHSQWGGAAGSVDAGKRKKLVLAAQYFLLHEPRWADAPCRFDVVAIEGSDPSTAGLNWLKNAFES